MASAVLYQHGEADQQMGLLWFPLPCVQLAVILLHLLLGFGNAEKGFQGGAAVAEEFHGLSCSNLLLAQTIMEFRNQPKVPLPSRCFFLRTLRLIYLL